jgi:hypothetical protein
MRSRQGHQTQDVSRLNDRTRQQGWPRYTLEVVALRLTQMRTVNGEVATSGALGCADVGRTVRHVMWWRTR